ncbi:MAG: 6-phosphofructokinase, partial [Anaerolineae bacterium]|nr:6-phosphofructokinase [Anaerolineae bacterium]
MTRTKTLAVLTGGGDVPGLNPCIKQVVNRAQEHGWRVIGFRRGWAGPLNFNPDTPAENDRWVVELDDQVVRTIDRTGGTFLHTSRTQPSNMRGPDVPEFLHTEGVDYDDPSQTFDLTAQAIQTLEYLGVDVLIPIGGDDTLGYGAR